MRKVPAPGQLSIFEPAPDELSADAAAAEDSCVDVVGEGPHATTPSGPHDAVDRGPEAAARSYVVGLVAQIARDVATLQMDATYHAPSREFYEERITAYREEVLRVRATERGA